MLARVIYCGWIGGCATGALATGTIVGGISVDTMLEKAGYEPLFAPMATDTIAFLHEK